MQQSAVAQPVDTDDSDHPEVVALALSGAAAGAVHLVAAPHHVDEYVPFGIAFVVVGLIQLAMAGAALRTRPDRLLTFTLVLSLGTAAAWAVAHSVGLPVGPHPWRPEENGPLGVLCSVNELVAAAACRVALRRPAGRAAASTQALMIAAFALASVTAMAVAGGAHGH